MTFTARLALIALAGLLLLPVAARAAAETPADHLRGQIARVLTTLEDRTLKRESRQAEIRKLASEIFDFTEMTRRCLGPHWQARTPAERQEMVELFTGLLERAYVAKLEAYSGERILWTGEAVDGEQATVRTRIVTRQGPEIPVDYRMLRRTDRWVVYDVAIEGVSLVANYRTQFNKIIQTSSYAELVRRLRGKTDEVTEPADPKAKRTSQR